MPSSVLDVPAGQSRQTDMPVMSRSWFGWNVPAGHTTQALGSSCSDGRASMAVPAGQPAGVVRQLLLVWLS